MNPKRRAQWRGVACLCVVWVSGTVFVVAAAAGGADDPPPQQADPLAALGITVTTGAAPGFVPDRLCGMCHSDLFASYQDVGMARSFYRPAAGRMVEDFSSLPYFHERSQRYYELSFEEGRLRFRRYQEDVAGEQINLFEVDVDWIMGSGNHSRVYLYRTSWGELYQLPLAWYSQTASWGMAPGFDTARHLGVTRRVRRECMFCHNAYPDVAAGSDDEGQPQLFPEELPEGIGCQRCHGPGAAHVRAVMADDTTPEQARAAIVNPGTLPAELRDSICFGCHMQPSVVITGLRRFGRATYSFLPGQLLSDYLVQVDVVEEGTAKEDRFEINHHPYRLLQSRCYTESPPSEISCLTCHDPHRKVPPQQRAAHYRAACLSCHEESDCGREHGPEPSPSEPQQESEADCTVCHMPEHRPQDVVQVVMTDHLIQVATDRAALVAPLEETIPTLTDVVPLFPEQAPKGDLWQAYRALAVIQAGGGRDAVLALDRYLAAAKPKAVDPYVVLGRSLLKTGQLRRAEEVLEQVLERSPGNAGATEWLALTRARTGSVEEAVRMLQEALEQGRGRPEMLYNLGVLALKSGQPEEAVAHLEAALEQAPQLAAAWLRLGQAHAAAEQPGEAIAALRQAVAVEPGFEEAYAQLARVLVASGEVAEARRYLDHGIRVIPHATALESERATLLRQDEDGS